MEGVLTKLCEELPYALLICVRNNNFLFFLLVPVWVKLLLLSTKAILANPGLKGMGTGGLGGGDSVQKHLPCKHEH